MSLGYTGFGRFKEETNFCVIYEYSGENLSAPFKDGDSLLFDGIISIEKSALKQEDIAKAIEDGRILVVRECKNAFYRYADLKFDYLAFRIVNHIFNDYKESGEIPFNVFFIQ